MSEIFLIKNKIIEFIKNDNIESNVCFDCLLYKFDCEKYDLLIGDEIETVCSYFGYKKYKEILEPKKILELKILGLERMKFLDIETKEDLTEEILELILLENKKRLGLKP